MSDATAYNPHLVRSVDRDPRDGFSDGWHYPAEDAPAPRRFGETISPAEAIGVMRRLYRKSFLRSSGKGGAGAPAKLPTDLPPLDANRELIAIKLPPRVLVLARAKAEAERRTLTSVIEESLALYGTSPMGAEPRYELPHR